MYDFLLTYHFVFNCLCPLNFQVGEATPFTNGAILSGTLSPTCEWNPTATPAKDASAECVFKDTLKIATNTVLQYLNAALCYALAFVCIRMCKRTAIFPVLVMTQEYSDT